MGFSHRRKKRKPPEKPKGLSTEQKSALFGLAAAALFLTGVYLIYRGLTG